MNIFPINKKTNHESSKVRYYGTCYISMMFYFQLLRFDNGEICESLCPR